MVSIISRRMKPIVLRRSSRFLSSKAASETLRSSVENETVEHVQKAVCVNLNKFVGHELLHLANINSTRLGHVISTAYQTTNNNQQQKTTTTTNSAVYSGYKRYKYVYYT